MTGELIPFPDRRASVQAAAAPAPAAPPPGLPEAFTPAWQAEHLPLVGQAMELLQADEAELQRRCRAMAGRSGRGLLADLAAQLDNLSSHIGDAAIALSLAALRIRRTMTALPT